MVSSLIGCTRFEGPLQREFYRRGEDEYTGFSELYFLLFYADIGRR